MNPLVTPATHAFNILIPATSQSNHSEPILHCIISVSSL
nr:MAG TPA: hypothetical protein [Bacteriophage sp.]